MSILVLITLYLVAGTRAEYACVCNYNTELEIYQVPDTTSTTLGRLYEFDCKPKSVVAVPSGFLAIQFEKQIGFIKANDQVQNQTCSGQPSPDDLFPTTSTTQSSTIVTSTKPPVTSSTRASTTSYKTTKRLTTTRMSTTRMTTRPITTTRTTMRTYKTTTRKPTATTIKMTSTMTSTIPPTTRRSTPPMTTMSTYVQTTVSQSSVVLTTQHMDMSTVPIVKDHLEVCPDHVQADVNLKGGFLGQYGEFCFEVVDWLRPFDAAESHCKITSGHLVAITNQNEQDYIQDLMSRNNFVNSSWIGLNDKNGEGVYKWTSGAQVTYKNFQGDFNQHSAQDHKLNDCFVMKQGGGWSDVPCGLAISFLGIGEQHPFICQYNVSAKVQSLFEIIPEFVG